MGSNLSKPCAGFPERENRRAEQERIQRMHMEQQARVTTSDTAPSTVHIHCGVDEANQFLDETNAASVMFHFKVVKLPVVKPENSLEGGETQSLVEKPGAAEIASAVLVEAKVAEPGGDAMVRSEPNGEVLVRSEPNGDIVVGTDAQPTELDLPMACLCNKVVRAIVEKSFRDSSERTKGHSAGEDPSPSSPSSVESQLSILSSGSQSVSPPVGAAESLHTGDVHHPNEEALLANDRKAPCESDLDLAVENVIDAAEEATTGKMQLDESFSEETLKEVAKAPPDVVSAETSDECSGVKTNLRTTEQAESLLRLGNDLHQAASEPHLILNEREEEIPEGYCDEENMGTQLQKRAQHETLAMVDSEGGTEWPIASEAFRTSESASWAHRRSSHAICEKTNAEGVLLVRDGVDLYDLQKDGANPTPEVMKVRNMETLPPTDVAEMTTEASSPKAVRNSRDRPGWTPEGSSACPAEPIGPVSRTEENHVGAQLSPLTMDVSGTVLQDGASGQRC